MIRGKAQSSRWTRAMNRLHARLAALARRPTGAVLQIAGFGLGILALLLLALGAASALAWRFAWPAWQSRKQPALTAAGTQGVRGAV